MTEVRITLVFTGPFDDVNVEAEYWRRGRLVGHSTYAVENGSNDLLTATNRLLEQAFAIMP